MKVTVEYDGGKIEYNCEHVHTFAQYSLPPKPRSKTPEHIKLTLTGIDPDIKAFDSEGIELRP